MIVQKPSEWLKHFSPAETIAGVYVLMGRETYLVRRAMKAIQSAAVADGAEMIDMQILDGNRIPNGRIIEAAAQLPLLSPRRLVVVRNDSRLPVSTGDRREDARKDKKEFRDSLQELCDALSDYTAHDTCVVFMCLGAVISGSSGVKALDKNGAVILDFSQTDPSDETDWIMTLASEEGGAISPADARFLVEYTGKTLDELENEIKRLVSYSENGRITAPVVEKLCQPSSSYTVFQMIDALCRGNRKRVMELYEMILEDSEDAALMDIVHLLSRQVRAYRMTIGNRIPAETAAKALQSQKFVIENGRRQAGRFPAALWRRISKWCVEADWKYRTTQWTGREAFDYIVLQMVEAVK